MSILTEYARGKPCTIRVPTVCNGDWNTTVCAHVRLIDVSGAGMKAADLLTAWACSACHDYVDGRTFPHDSYETRRLMLLEGHARTLTWLIEHGVITVKGAREPRIEKLNKIVPRRTA